MWHKTPRKPARQILLFCFVILLLLGGMGIILISIQEENRAYSDSQAEADSLLEELRSPSCQETPEAAEEKTEDYLDRAEELLDTESLPRNGYYAFVCEKCAPVFGHYGYFATEAELKRRAKEIHDRD